MSSFRVSTSQAKEGCEYDKYQDHIKYPYVNFLPFTAPSAEAKAFDTEVADAFIGGDKMDIQGTRKRVTVSDTDYPIQDTKRCKATRERINGVSCDWIEYEGSDIRNGVIINLHGGGYVLCSHIKLFAQSELMSKQTGMVCLCVDYSLAPEYPLPICVDEVVSIYEYLLNKRQVDPKRIFFAGGSAGGGLILLTLQKLKAMNMPQPCAVWMDSPWTDLSKDASSDGSYNRNMDLDIVCGGGNALHELAQMAVGNMDMDRNIINNFDLKDPKFSGIYGDFDGLCPMYFTVCATEILFDDTLLTAEKAYNRKIDVRVDVVPFLLHCFVYKVNKLPEAYMQTVIATEWMMRQKKKHLLSAKL